ncbi:MAG: thioredoxin family protein [Actinomycetota bacterium]|nr:thioredoxin family protein [Actinomycetota bacterium]
MTMSSAPASGASPDIQLLFVDDCPNLAATQAALYAALRRLGIPESVQLRRVDTEEEAQRLGMRGSPTVLIDGVDPFEGEVAAGLSCRIFSTAGSRSAAPTVEQLTDVLRRADIA